MFKKPGTVSSVLWEVKTKIEGTLSFRYGNPFFEGNVLIFAHLITLDIETLDVGRQITPRKTNLR